VQHLHKATDTPELFLYYVNPNMTDAEKVSLSSYLIAFARIRERDWLQYKSGALDETT